MTFSLPQLALGLTLAVIVALLAYRAHSLDRSGALAAAALGTIVFGLGGLAWAVLLLAFFITSSGLSRLFKSRKAAIEEKFSKGSRRDAWQVAANGGISGLFVLLHVVFPNAVWPWVGFAGSLAAANADTWATELGVLSRAQPWLITTRKPVEAGTSGAVSIVGTLAALTGAGLIGVLAVLLWEIAIPTSDISLRGALFWPLALALAGLFGSLIDSWLGATHQAIFYCTTCQKETERHPLHLCGTPTRHQRGFSWLDNDRVNLICTLSGGILAALIAAAIAPQTTQDLSSYTRMEGTPMPAFILTSPAFTEGEMLTARFTCDAENLSPQIDWTTPPAGTRSLALIVDDPDAPVGVFTHWVYYNLPATLTGLPEGVVQSPSPKGIGMQGMNNFRHNWYDGPCPPRGNPHRYYFKLYALDTMLDLPAGQSAQQLMEAMRGHIIAQAQLMGRYQR